MFQIDEEEENLQCSVSEKAYLVIETFHKSNEAAELVSMLGAIAKKPLSITELVQKSDMSTIIKMINKEDCNQEKWFRALFTTQVFKNKEALNCINRWAHLCNEDDVTLLLNLNTQTNDEEFRKLIVKCATCLSLEKLMVVCTKHFYRNKFSHILDEYIGPSITTLFNKLNENKLLLSDLEKDLILLLLKNPLAFFIHIISECVKNKFYTDCMSVTFERIKEISKIDNIGIVLMKEVMNKIIPNSQNITNYTYLFVKLYAIGYFTLEDLILKILFPIIKQSNEEGRLEEVINVLQIITVKYCFNFTIL